MRTARFTARILSMALLLMFVTVVVPRAYAYTDLDGPSDIRAVSALLADADTGELLFEKNIHARREPASLTNIMTTMLTLESYENWDTQKDTIIYILLNFRH